MRDCHPAIIDRDTWDRVHLEFARRSAQNKSKTTGRKNAKHYCLSDIMICAHCGATFKRTLWKSGGVNIPVWRCGNRLDHGKRLCQKGASIHEDRLHRTVINAVNEMIENPEKVETAIAETMEKQRAEIISIDEEIAGTNTELKKIDSRRSEIMDLITPTLFDTFKEELKQLNGRELEYKEKLEQLELRKNAVQLAVKKAITARELFASAVPLTKFDDLMIPKLVERILVKSKNEITVVLRGGVEVERVVEK